MKIYKIRKSSVNAYAVLLVKKYFFGLIEIYHCLERFPTLAEAENFLEDLKIGKHKDLIP